MQFSNVENLLGLRNRIKYLFAFYIEDFRTETTEIRKTHEHAWMDERSTK